MTTSFPNHDRSYEKLTPFAEGSLSEPSDKPTLPNAELVSKSAKKPHVASSSVSESAREACSVRKNHASP
eukprot:1987916-Prymnesium_polylepis.1